jgi:SAM-dependent methyltransferase
MSQLEPTGDNADQIEFWNGEAGAKWSDRNDEMDTMLRPLGEEAIARAAPKSGECVLDIGCGCGDTTFAIAASVGTAGRVLGVDISAPMLARANHKGEEIGGDINDVTAFQLADASTFDFPPAAYDLLFSRFGVMFFADPTTAFANMRTSLKPGGRLAFLCWGPVEENDWVTVPLMAALAHLPPPEPMDPKAPGPFAFSDRDYVTGILTQAGFSDIKFEATHPVMRSGLGQSLDEKAQFFVEMGPLVRALVDQPDDVLSKVADAIKEAIAPHQKDGATELQGKCWIVTAKNTP